MLLWFEKVSRQREQTGQSEVTIWRVAVGHRLLVIMYQCSWGWLRRPPAATGPMSHCQTAPHRSKAITVERFLGKKRRQAGDFWPGPQIGLSIRRQQTAEGMEQDNQ